MLRPLLRTAAPRRLPIQPAAFLRPITTTTPTAAAPTTTDAPNPTLTSPPPPQQSPQKLHAQSFPPLDRPGPPNPSIPYTITRTPYKKLPVYNLLKRGGSKKLTVVKKVEGDLRAFKAALCKELGLWEDQVSVKSPTNHVQVEGNRMAEICSWLAKQGF